MPGHTKWSEIVHKRPRRKLQAQLPSTELLPSSPLHIALNGLAASGMDTPVNAPPGPTSALMSHADRQKLIRLPFHSQVVAGRSWGGTTLGNSGTVPVEGHRTWIVSPTDESYLRYGKPDDEGTD